MSFPGETRWKGRVRNIDRSTRPLRDKPLNIIRRSGRSMCREWGWSMSPFKASGWASRRSIDRIPTSKKSSSTRIGCGKEFKPMRVFYFLKPLFLFEEIDQTEGDSGHDDPKRVIGTFPVILRHMLEIHSVDSHDESQGKKDSGGDGETLHDKVQPIGRLGHLDGEHGRIDLEDRSGVFFQAVQFVEKGVHFVDHVLEIGFLIGSDVGEIGFFVELF